MKPAPKGMSKAPAPKEVAPAKSNAVRSKNRQIKPPKQKGPWTYPGTFFSQRSAAAAPKFVVFAASAGEVLQWADIERLGPGVKGVQRRENAAKRHQIKSFFGNQLNTIPAAVVIALDGVAFKEGAQSLTIPKASADLGAQKPGLVIDGQHRLLGISDFDPNVKVPVVAILKATDEEKAFQFLVINNKGSKVSQNHIKALALNYTRENLSERLTLARIALDNDLLKHVDIINSSKESPFQKRVKFPNTKGKLKKIVPEAFERALEYIESQHLPKLDDADIQRDFFVAIWRGVLRSWGKAIFDDKCRLTEKVGVICMSRYLVDRLASKADEDDFDLDLSDLDEIEVQVEKLLQRQSLEFWNAKWKGSGYDTAVGHAKVLEAIVRIFRNLKAGRDWGTDIDILDKK
jgi:DGQHR domain-containing protein